MMNLPLLSVLVITYNQEKFISQTLESILSQKHGYSYEIVIGEDCSTDGTRKVIEEYEKKYPGIIKPIYNLHNLGVINNYFNTLSQCTGKYIMQCAGDDYWLPGKVAFQIDYMESHPEVGMCYGKAEVWSEAGNKKIKKTFGSKRESFDQFLKANDVPAPSVCFRNELIRKYVSQIDPCSKDWLMEDYPEWLWLSRNSVVKYTDRLLCCYRFLENSVSHSSNILKKIKLEKSREDIVLYFANRYNYNYIRKNEDSILFHIYVEQMFEHYSRTFAKLLQTYYKRANIKGIKMAVYYIASKNIVLWKLLSFFINVKRSF